MAYLNDYLKVIPEYDATQIRQALKASELNYAEATVSEQEFERLVHEVQTNKLILTEPLTLGEKLDASVLNNFYKHLGVDLARLFSEQASIEVASQNYHHIYEGTLEELAKEVDSLKQAIYQLERQSRLEKGVILREYSFEPTEAVSLEENLNDETAYLFVDRNGQALNQAERQRLYHNYSLGLHKNVEENVLRDKQGVTTATLEVLYETPGTLTNNNPRYTPDQALDSSTQSFWFNVCLKSNNQLDKVSISPKGWG